MRWLRRLARALAAIAIILGLGTLVPRPFLAPAADAPRERRILLLSNPIHTDIAIPIDPELRQVFGFLANDGFALDIAGAEYVIFGWGSRAFYLETPTWSQLKAGPLFKGLTLDDAAMHVALAGNIPPGDDAVELMVSESGYRDLTAYIRSSFAERPDGAPKIIPGSGYGPYDVFYEANGAFTALLGCNTWTARGLRTAGIQTGLWNPLPVLLRASVRLHNPV